MNRKALGLLSHRTPTRGRCYGQTPAGGRGSTGRSDPRDGSAADAHYERVVSDGLSARAHDRAAARVDPAGARAVLDGRHSPGPRGAEPGLVRDRRPPRATVPAHRGDAGGVLSAV